MFGFGKVRKRPQRRRLIIEQLEMRSVLSGVAMGAQHTHVHHHDSDHHTTTEVHSASVANSIAAPHIAQQAQSVQHTQLATPAQTVHSTAHSTTTKTGSHTENEGNDGESGESEGSETELSATLSDPSGASSATGSVKYLSGQEDGASTAHFSVSVKGATPGASLDVSIDGVSVGTITPDANGNGSLTLSSNSTTGKTSSLPTTVNAGSNVKVGDSLTGTLTVSQQSGNGESHDRED